MAVPVYTKLMWSGMERVKADKLAALQGNYEAVRFLWNRTPRGLIAIASSSAPVTITSTNQVILTLSVYVEAGRAYKVRAVNNNVVYNNTSGGVISINKDGNALRNNIPFWTAAGAGLYNAKTFNLPYASEYLDICQVSEIATYSISATWPSSHNYQYKLDSTTITGFGGAATTLFNQTNIGSYYLTVEDKGVIDI